MSNSTFEHVERRTIAADVRERIIDAIRRDELKVGDLLPAERVLCDEFGGAAHVHAVRAGRP